MKNLSVSANLAWQIAAIFNSAIFNSGDTILIFSSSFNIKLNMTPQNSKTASEFSKAFPEYPRKRDRINPRLVDAFVNPLHMSFPLEFGSQLLP